MPGFLVITFPDTSVGFRLAGIEVMEVTEDRDLKILLEGLIERGDYGLLAVEERLLAKVPDEILRRIRKKGIPVIVPIDTPRSWYGEVERETYILRLIRRAIGYQIKIKGV